ncbi:MAG: methyltransferase [Pseudomonadota bacterium]
MTDTRASSFLDGRLTIEQPVTGYRAGADPVFLAAAVGASAGEQVLELGCGVGTAFLCLGARVPGLDLTGVELQPALAELAERNLARNGIKGRVIAADLAALPLDLRARRFDHVLMNPPFFRRDEGSSAPDDSREQGRGETIDLMVWLDVALRRIKPGGTLTVVNRIERLPECLAGIAKRAGDVTVLPLAPRRDRAAKLFLLGARKGAKGPFVLKAPLVLHRGARHVADGESYTDAAQNILRKAAALPLLS